MDLSSYRPLVHTSRQTLSNDIGSGGHVGYALDSDSIARGLVNSPSLEDGPSSNDIEQGIVEVCSLGLC